ncbi:serine-aspartate repeat-containing protein I-like [Pseudophryne corroboree]|uniref:serine-aspartate repeat-containing protein I-like n=1 Tax=Pseudophryne corroboree TaxID=495146 RepID=UPI003081DCB7
MGNTVLQFPVQQLSYMFPSGKFVKPVSQAPAIAVEATHTPEVKGDAPALASAKAVQDAPAEVVKSAILFPANYVAPADKADDDATADEADHATPADEAIDSALADEAFDSAKEVKTAILAPAVYAVPADNTDYEATPDEADHATPADEAFDSTLVDEAFDSVIVDEDKDAAQLDEAQDVAPVDEDSDTEPADVANNVSHVDEADDSSLQDKDDDASAVETKLMITTILRPAACTPRPSVPDRPSSEELPAVTEEERSRSTASRSIVEKEQRVFEFVETLEPLCQNAQSPLVHKEEKKEKKRKKNGKKTKMHFLNI